MVLNKSKGCDFIKLINNAYIWDLHIHTNKCPKGSSEFKRDYEHNTVKFIDDLLKVFTNYPLLKMISFTDHNFISHEVYKEFYSRKVDINLIPGIEIDFLSNITPDKSKHLIIYFDISQDKLENFCEEINCLLKETREKSKYMKIEELLPKIRDLGYDFLISPHAFKQGNKGLDVDWYDEAKTKENMTLYMDQFFCFWEASGYSHISKGKEFLEDFENSNKISIISFSDSNSFKKINGYLEHPDQYFRSLPTYKGLALVANEGRRIVRTSEKIIDSNKSKYIKTIEIGDKTIELSTRLNTIIGGRGSGKSLLLDSIANKLGEEITPINRKKYINEKFEISLKDFNGLYIESFNIDYFNQAYISEIFNSNDYSVKLEGKFSDSFKKVSHIDKEEIKLKNKTIFSNKLNVKSITEPENLEGIITTIPKISDDGLNIKILRKDKINGDDLIDLDLAKVLEKINKSIPKDLINNSKVNKVVNILYYTILKESQIFNNLQIHNKIANNIFIDNFIGFKTKKTDKSKKKTRVLKSLEKKLNELSLDYINRANLINSIISSTENFKKIYREYHIEDGIRKNRFIFAKELIVETPLEFFHRILEQYLDKTKINQTLKKKFEEIDSKELFRIYLYSIDTLIKDSMKIEDLSKELNNFELKYDEYSNIYYVNDESEILNIKDLSPGYQTNVLMEYIVNRNTDIPLLIDQPEDNVDNETVYKYLKKWFWELKYKRQVIVVTHDANIVLNSDSDNIIIAKQVKVNDFVYDYGSLEYSDIIERSATILDGGKDAVKRRLSKYESTT